MDDYVFKSCYLVIEISVFEFKAKIYFTPLCKML